MAKFPEPPDADALADIPPVTRTLPAGTTLVRIFFAGGAHPTDWNGFRHFGPTASRFDHHLPGPKGEADGSVQERGILYAALGRQAFPTALAEVFQTARTIDRRARDPAVVFFRTSVPLVLLDLGSAFATRIGASMAINTGPRSRARRWARRLHEAYPEAHGIHYPSSMHANEPAVALFEHAVGALPAAPELLRPLADPRLTRIVRETATTIGYRWR